MILRFNILTGQLAYPILAFFYFFIFIWIVWRIEDWRNDLFRLTDRLIIDIDAIGQDVVTAIASDAWKAKRKSNKAAKAA